jgi:Cys-rich repeat protein
VCDTAHSLCVQCITSGDCSALPAKMCATDGQCVACLANGDCPAMTPICRAGVCAQCLRTRDCAAGQVCLLGTCR